MKLKDILINDYLFSLGLISENKVGMHICPYREENNKSFLILRDGLGFKDFTIDDKVNNIYTLVERLGIATIPKSRVASEWQEFTNTALLAIGETATESYTKKRGQEKIPKTNPTREFSVTPFTDKRLSYYMQSRGVSTKVVSKLVKSGDLAQVNIKSNKTGKFYSYVGFKNVKQGYSCRNSIMKSSIGKSGISKIGGKGYTFYIANSTSNIEVVLADIKENNITSAVIFEGFFDFLSFVSSKKCMSWAKKDAINLALDNGQGGDIATIKAKLELEDANDLRSNYKGYEDVNDFILGKKGAGKYPRLAYSTKERTLAYKKSEDDYLLVFRNEEPKDILGIAIRLIATNQKEDI